MNIHRITTKKLKAVSRTTFAAVTGVICVQDAAVR